MLTSSKLQEGTRRSLLIQSKRWSRTSSMPEEGENVVRKCVVCVAGGVLCLVPRVLVFTGVTGHHSVRHLLAVVFIKGIISKGNCATRPSRHSELRI